MAERGRPFKYTAEQLESKFEEYKEHIKKVKFYKPEMIKTGERQGEIVDVPVYSPPDMLSFCLFIGISFQTFNEYVNGEYREKREDLSEIFTRVHEWIKSEQLRGASAGLYNAQIVARINGLSDKQEVELTTQIQSIVLPLPTK